MRLSYQAIACIIALAAGPFPSLAQESAPVAQGSVAAANKGAVAILAPVALTADQDRANMMLQLGIKSMRPGFSGMSYGVPEKGDAHWLDHEGSFMATVDASRVFTLLGAKGIDFGGDYHTTHMPPVNEGLLDGQLAWRQHDGGHTDAPNMKYFIQWADRFIGHTPPS